LFVINENMGRFKDVPVEINYFSSFKCVFSEESPVCNFDSSLLNEIITASVYSVFDEDKIASSKFRSSEPVRKSLNL